MWGVPRPFRGAREDSRGGGLPRPFAWTWEAFCPQEAEPQDGLESPPPPGSPWTQPSLKHPQITPHERQHLPAEAASARSSPGQGHTDTGLGQSLSLNNSGSFAANLDRLSRSPALRAGELRKAWPRGCGGGVGWGWGSLTGEAVTEQEEVLLPSPLAGPLLGRWSPSPPSPPAERGSPEGRWGPGQAELGEQHRVQGFQDRVSLSLARRGSVCSTHLLLRG